MKKTYTIMVHKEEGIYWGECSELKGCFAQATSIEELTTLMIESICLYYNDNIEEKRNEIELELSYA